MVLLWQYSSIFIIIFNNVFYIRSLFSYGKITI
ncbi:hypothetical protein Pmani_009044 [Petrolisthes manimaculis]|uniref:Uncharacterized protein n=1 Tax=Petrolisthes manimaculis TaxID=1843537 RepID=A0AAE1Q558_9EUCA|nr:hypothetical protein Pmani_009044 [Petrolisthes manimaculis]